MKPFVCLLFVSLLCFPIIFSTSEKESSKEREIAYTAPSPGKFLFFEPFSNDSSRWLVSSSFKYSGKWVTRPPHNSSIPGDIALIANSSAEHHAIAVPFKRDIETKHEDIVIQFEVKFENDIFCGGAYLKLLSKGADFKRFNSDTPYSIMFGPDKCGTDTKLHFILRHANPLTGVISEHSLVRPTIRPVMDNKAHLYSLHIKTNNEFIIEIDQDVKKVASLLTHLDPPINPPKKIDDPMDIKPYWWVDDAEIPDVYARKPDDWDENQPRYIPDLNAQKPEGWREDIEPLIPDPKANKPAEWSDEEDGEFIPSMIKNPLCPEVGCGKWTPPKKTNPDYKGTWERPRVPNPRYKGPYKPRQIPNPDFFEDLHPHEVTPISGIGIELWTTDRGITFDNILIVRDKQVADEYAQKTWRIKRDIESEIPIVDAEKPLTPFERYMIEFEVFVEDNLLILATAFFGGVIPLVFYVSWKLASTPPRSKEVSNKEDEKRVEIKDNQKESKKTPKESQHKGSELNRRPTPKRK